MSHAANFLAELQFPIEIGLDELAGMQGWHLEGEELAAYVEGRMDELNFESSKTLCVAKWSTWYSAATGVPLVANLVEREKK